MKVLLLGSGGREHALAWKLAQSPLLDKLFIAPGNPGTSRHGTNVSLDILDSRQVGNFCIEEHIDLVVVGPEEPLVRGLRDDLLAFPGLEHLMICGPGREGARLEGSKAYAKAFMARHGIPTAAYREFEAGQWEEVRAWLERNPPPYVIKADGLAAGKGVIITPDREEAGAVVRQMFDGQFGDAGRTVVLEAFLDGIEFSVFVLTDGQDYRILPSAKDYKRIGAGDTGPNTGGMGAVSPVPFLDEALMDKVRDRIIGPTIRGLREEGTDYQGFIFFGLIRVGGDPFVIEYNCRMGDPETEVVMPRLEGDLLALLRAMGDRKLAGVPAREAAHHAVTVMLVSEGYPGAYPKGRVITGVPDHDLVFHAGTGRNAEGALETRGGRVLACTATGPDLPACLQEAYRLAGQVRFEGMYFRPDIGKDLS